MAEQNILSYLPASNESELEELQDRIDIVRHKLMFVELKPTVACLENLDPMQLAGNWMPELIRIAGGTPVEQTDLTGSNPAYIIVALKGHTIEQTLSQINLLLDLPGCNELDAIKNGNLYIADASRYFNGSENGVVDTIEMIAEILNSKQFTFGYEGQGWVKFGL
ncbi:substrate-binding domain-containing protein [Arcticibacter eurypsychrophilus]|uniref:hypothetical protein n=1 Tax=Arcticibacter eurypsychrophilus TaxID=1434752 RepID=UPI00084D5939|nr:hypothetical protein [Arcticibacter eurypsychrophilus]